MLRSIDNYSKLWLAVFDHGFIHEEIFMNLATTTTGLGQDPEGGKAN